MLRPNSTALKGGGGGGGGGEGCGGDLATTTTIAIGWGESGEWTQRNPLSRDGLRHLHELRGGVRRRQCACVFVCAMQFVSESESDDELLPPAKIPKVESSDGDSEDEEAAEFAPTGLDDEEPQSGADDWVIGVVYRRTVKFIVVSHPLFGTHYFGQFVRRVARYGTDADIAVAKRWQEENSQALREYKRLGHLAVIREFGADALENAVLNFKVGFRRDVQPWADEQEIANIAEYGGPLRDMHVCLPQTLNMNRGGKGGIHMPNRLARNSLAWHDFQLALTEYITEHGTAYVPAKTVLPSGYRLGKRVVSVRQGELWEGLPTEQTRRKWLDSRPGWAWKAAESDEWKSTASKLFKERWSNLSPDERTEHSRKCSEAQNRPEVRAGKSKSKKDWWSNMTSEEYNEHCRKYSEGQRRPEVCASRSKKQKDWWAGLTADDRNEQIRKQNEAQRRPEVRAAASEKTKQQFATQEARDAASQRTKQQFANETDEKRAERIRRKNDGQRRPEVRAAASGKSKQQFATQEARDAVSERTKQQFANETDEQRAERIRKSNETKRLPEVRAAASERTKQQFATQEARDRQSEGHRKAAKDRHEAKLATLSAAEQAKARASFQRNQDKQAHRKRRLDALRQIAGWERASMPDLPKAKAAGIVLQVCSCGVVCECKAGQGSSSDGV